MEPPVINHLEHQSTHEADPNDQQVQQPKAIRGFVDPQVKYNGTGDVLQSTDNVEEGYFELLWSIIGGDEVEQENRAQHNGEEVVRAAIVGTEVGLVEDVDKVAHEQDVHYHRH